MVILEGMLHGLSIAATAVGGPLDILQDERNALFFPPRDAEALAHAIIKLVRRPQLRHRLGQEAAKEVRRNWLWSKIVEKMYHVYEEVAVSVPVSLMSHLESS